MNAIPEVDAVLALACRDRIAAPFDHPAYRALFARAGGASRAELDALVRALSAGLDVADLDHAACIAISCGSLVEQGASTSIAGSAIVRRLREVADVAAREERATRHLVLAAMAHLARDVALRVASRRIEGLVEALERAEDHVPDAWFPRETLLLADEVELLVLAPAQRRGYLVRADGVRSNYHLFTLLQGALIGDPREGWLEAEPVDAGVLAAATGERAPARELTDRARFQFHHASALAPDGSLRGSIATSLWSGDVSTGQMSVPRVAIGGGRSAHVVVLGPPILGSLTWGSSFFACFHDALRARAEVTAKLSEPELAEAIAGIARG